MASFQELEFAEMQVRLGEARAERDEFRRRLQEEIDSHKRTLSLQDDEVAEFNAGYEACKNGEPIDAEPSDLPFDVWQHGWKVADHERISAEVAALRAALGGYADSNLVSLATTLRAAADASAAHYEAMEDAQEEAADLRRQLAECQSEIATLRRERVELLAELDGMSAQLSTRR